MTDDLRQYWIDDLVSQGIPEAEAVALIDEARRIGMKLREKRAAEARQKEKEREGD